MSSTQKRDIGKVAPKADVSIAVPILCKFWLEDGVWNGVAEDLPVAVFGNTFEDAKENLRSAIESHVESAVEKGEILGLVRHLMERGREYLSVDEISPGSPLVKMLVAMKNQEVVTVTA